MILSKKNGIYIFIGFLLLIIITLISILIYYLYNTKSNVIIIEKTMKPTVQTDKPIIIQQQQQPEIPVYPRDLPKYNNEDYQQIGILTSNETDKDPIILPLFSKKLQNHKERFNYYTASDKNNMMRLPINFDNMKCDDTIGCKEIYDGDTLYIEIYKGRIFTATVYKKDVPQYFADKY